MTTFNWWVPRDQKKRDYIVSKDDARVKRVTHKYGTGVPEDWNDAMRIDEANGNTLWQDAIAKEMDTVNIAFVFLKKGQKVPPGWEKPGGHLVYDVQMDFTRKARWVKWLSS